MKTDSVDESFLYEFIANEDYGHIASHAQVFPFRFCFVEGDRVLKGLDVVL